LASGCNKPEVGCAEETIEVVRNHEDGTSEADGIRLAEAAVARSLWEWTRTDESMKRHAGGTPARVGRTNPKGVRQGKARVRRGL
jgi:hypothetical protein